LQPIDIIAYWEWANANFTAEKAIQYKREAPLLPFIRRLNVLRMKLWIWFQATNVSRYPTIKRMEKIHMSTMKGAIPMYKTGKLMDGKLYLKTITGNWISLKMLAQADRKTV
jgi:hypothetical protein